MKKYLCSYILFIGMLLLASCEVNNSDPKEEKDPVQDSIPVINPDPEYFFKIGKELYYRYSDIELYDSSAHILYFKTSHPEFDNNSKSYFSVIVKNDTIYSGDFWPSYRSDSPKRAYIHSWPFWLQSYALWIENRYNNMPDLRNAPAIIQALKDHDLLHSGLKIEMKSLVVTNTEVKFAFSLINKDQSALLILDPEKMGINLFHYFTNGLLFKKAGSSSVTVKVSPETPSPWNTWKPDWLTKLNTSETRSYNIVYPLSSPLANGEYSVTFDYPGLHSQISKDELIRDNARIWLGAITLSFRFTI